MQDALLDRIWSVFKETDRAWTAEEVAAEFLRLTGPSPEALVRAILAKDSRFLEDPSGSWRALSVPARRLRDQSFLLVWVESGERSLPQTWRVHLRAYGSGAQPERLGGSALPTCLQGDSPDAWEQIRGAYSNHYLATYQAGALQRFLQWMERRWALPEWQGPLLDLQSWARAALVEEGVSASQSLGEARLPALLRRWDLGPIPETTDGVALPALEALLDRLLERAGDRTEEQLLQASQGVLGTRALDWSGFSFVRGDLDAVPPDSGLYRFFDRAGRLLYVGKAVNLARRIHSYFRPLPPETSKREELLGQIHRFEVETIPSELEALVREARAIPGERPPWNVQVEVHRPESLPPEWWWPVVFLAPGRDSSMASAFFLPGPDQGFSFHLPRAGQEHDREGLAAWLDQMLQKTPNGPIPEGWAADPMDPPEVWLVLRFLLRQRDQCDRIDSVHFSSGYSLAEAILSLAERGGAIGETVDQRPATSS